jgi:hypothetical protein
VVIVFSSVTLSLAAASLASPSAPSPSSPDPDVDANVRPRAAYSRTNIPVALARAPLARSRRARAGFAVELAVEPPAIVATSRAAASACAHEDDSARAGRSMSGVTIARARRAHRVATDDDDIVARAPECGRAKRVSIEVAPSRRIRTTSVPMHSPRMCIFR